MAKETTTDDLYESPADSDSVIYLSSPIKCLEVTQNRPAEVEFTCVSVFSNNSAVIFLFFPYI